MLIIGYRWILDIMQSAIVVLVISFIWFYIGCFPFKYYIHELVSLIQFMYELVLLVHVYSYLDNRLSLDIIGMFPYNPIMGLSLCYTNDSSLS